MSKGSKKLVERAGKTPIFEQDHCEEWLAIVNSREKTLEAEKKKAKEEEDFMLKKDMRFWQSKGKSAESFVRDNSHLFKMQAHDLEESLDPEVSDFRVSNQSLSIFKNSRYSEFSWEERQQIYANESKRQQLKLNKIIEDRYKI